MSISSLEVFKVRVLQRLPRSAGFRHLGSRGGSWSGALTSWNCFSFSDSLTAVTSVTMSTCQTKRNKGGEYFRIGAR